MKTTLFASLVGCTLLADSAAAATTINFGKPLNRPGIINANTGGSLNGKTTATLDWDDITISLCTTSSSHHGTSFSTVKGLSRNKYLSREAEWQEFETFVGGHFDYTSVNSGIASGNGCPTTTQLTMTGAEFCAGREITLYALVSSGPRMSSTISLTVNGLSGTTISHADCNGWNPSSVTFTPAGSLSLYKITGTIVGSDGITLTQRGSSSAGFAAISYVCTGDAVPEPTTVTLSLAALMGLCLRRRRA